MLLFAIDLRQFGKTNRLLQRRGPTQRHQQLQIEDRRAAIGVLRRVAVGPLRDPVEVAPPGQGSERPVRLLIALEEAQHPTHSRQHAAYESGVGHVPVVIVHHPRPPEREPRDVLFQARRIAAHGAPVALPRVVEQVDGVAHQPRVAGLEQRDQALHARIARVLQLLVVRAVHVCLVGAQSRCAPAHVENLIQLRHSGVELCLAHERKARGGGADPFHCYRLVLALDLQLKITIGAPPQRTKHAVRSAIQDELIVVADELLALDLVAIPLLVGIRLK